MKGMRPLTPDEVTRLLGVTTDPRDRALLALQYATGSRVSEVLSLTVGDVRGLDEVRFERRNTKGKHEGRALPLNAAAVEAVGAYLATRPEAMDAEPLFLSRKGGALGRVQAYRLLLDAATRADIDAARVGTHSVRKGAATRMSKAGIPIAVIAEVLGHRSIETTRKYIGVDGDDVRRAVALLA